MEILQFLILPFVASLILTGIHAYLGVHVVERGVIFVDLALAQIAALGATIAILQGMDPHGTGAYWFSLAFTFLGAAIFALVRSRRRKIPLEAIIGIAYAVASAGAILATSKAIAAAMQLAKPAAKAVPRSPNASTSQASPSRAPATAPKVLKP